MKKRITILGATGFTGRIIVEQLSETGRSFSIAGRNITTLNELKTSVPNIDKIIQIDVFDDNQMDSLLEKTDILINCVGPYNIYGQQLLTKVRFHDIIYMDLTGEQSFVKNSFDEYRNNSEKYFATILHSISFESTLADLLAAEICHTGTCYHDISAYYILSDMGPSPGTRLTMKLANHFPHYAYQNSNYVKASPLSLRKTINSHLIVDYNNALFMPYPEIIFYANRYKTENAASYLLLPRGLDNVVFKNDKKSQTQSVEQIVNNHIKQNYIGPSLHKRLMQTFHLLVIATHSDNTSKSILLSGNDTYGITAQLIVQCLKICEQKQNIKAGVFAPSVFFEETTVLNSLCKECNCTIRL